MSSISKPIQLLTAAAIGMALSMPIMAADIPKPTLCFPFDEGQGQATSEVISGAQGKLRGSPRWSEGRSGSDGDKSIHFMKQGGNYVSFGQSGFTGKAVENNQITVSFWQKRMDPNTFHPTTAFEIVSPSASHKRGALAHTVWKNGHVYWDTAGCCGPDVRISTSMEFDEDKLDDKWHNFVFVKNGDEKEIWIDGKLFHKGKGVAPLVEFKGIRIGKNFDGSIDDFAIWDTALNKEQIEALYTKSPCK